MTARWHNYPDDHLLTQDQCAEFARCSRSTIAAHRLGGLLAYKPTRPVTIPVYAFKLYMRMMANGVRSKLHRSMHIDAADAAVYSRLDGVIAAPTTDAKAEIVIATVVRESDLLWRKYKAQQKEKAKRAARKAAA